MTIGTDIGVIIVTLLQLVVYKFQKADITVPVYVPLPENTLGDKENDEETPKIQYLLHDSFIKHHRVYLFLMLICVLGDSLFKLSLIQILLLGNFTPYYLLGGLTISMFLWAYRHFDRSTYDDKFAIFV